MLDIVADELNIIHSLAKAGKIKLVGKAFVLQVYCFSVYLNTVIVEYTHYGLPFQSQGFNIE